MASSRSEENVYPNHIQHQMVSQCWISLQFYRDLCFYILLADVIAIVCFYQIWLNVIAIYFYQMLADVIAICLWFISKPLVLVVLGRCYSPAPSVIDVISLQVLFVTDV